MTTIGELVKNLPDLDSGESGYEALIDILMSLYYKTSGWTDDQVKAMEAQEAPEWLLKLVEKLKSEVVETT